MRSSDVFWSIGVMLTPRKSHSSRSLRADAATLGGLLLGAGCLIVALWLEGGHLGQLVNLPAALIVLGGTFGATLAGLGTQQLRDLPGILRQAFVHSRFDLAQTMRLLVHLSDKARREGLLALEDDAQSIPDEFLRNALQLAIDGTDPELVRDILQLEITFVEERHRQGEQIFTSMGGYAPTMGVLGTVMGLIHMMSRIENPSQMGPAIATAFVATLYGVSFANLLFLPIASKLRARHAEEILLREVIVEGVLAIQSGENPRIVEQRLRAFLSARQRRSLPVLRWHAHDDQNTQEHKAA
ncbi:MAG: flagellar motor protein [Armatimonadota bacterium]|nr:flagellar motor protein [bacterium]MCS7310164.1 flagellar motor protein [Armatimonadota bacterium]MDW8105616.1 flagellar motor protein [Armatimonadota bacterium]MDW8290769.1 flagellar motor protein [Armatimonadota bacterium]